MAKKPFIEGIRILTHENHLKVTLNLSCDGGGGYFTELSLKRNLQILAFAATGIRGGRALFELVASPVSFWTPARPSLCDLDVMLLNADGEQVDGKTVRIGFRDAVFCNEGFFLNGRMISLAALDLTKSPDDLHEPKRIKGKKGVRLVLCDTCCVDGKNAGKTDEFLTGCDEVGLLAAGVLPLGYGQVDMSKAILRLGHHPSLCAWVIKGDSWKKETAAQVAKDDPRRALLQLDTKTGNTFILGGRGEKTQMTRGITLLN